MTSSLTRERAVIELIFAAIIWGFGFVATEWALQTMGSYDILFYRYILAVISGEIIRQVFFRNNPPFNKEDLKRAWPAGIILSFFLILQTVGMEYTTATNSGFLTSLYVILVPFINHTIFRVKSSNLVYSMAALAFFGAFLLMGAQLQNLNWGDILTLMCAVLGAVHIIYVGKISAAVKDVVRFNTWQSVFCFIPLLPFWLLSEKRDLAEASALSWGGVVALAVGSSAIAFALQVRAQKVLSDTTASMMFLLEGVFAFFFAFIFLHERLSWVQLGGAIFILMSSALTVLWDSPSHSKSKS